MKLTLFRNRGVCFFPLLALSCILAPEQSMRWLSVCYSFCKFILFSSVTKEDENILPGTQTPPNLLDIYIHGCLLWDVSPLESVKLWHERLRQLLSLWLPEVMPPLLASLVSVPLSPLEIVDWNYKALPHPRQITRSLCCREEWLWRWGGRGMGRELLTSCFLLPRWILALTSLDFIFSWLLRTLHGHLHCVMCTGVWGDQKSRFQAPDGMVLLQP